MTKKTSNRYSREVRARAVRMVHEHAGEHASRWAAVGGGGIDRGQDWLRAADAA